MKNKTVSATHNRWALTIVVANNYALEVEVDDYPVNAVLTLCDATPEDYRKIALMFIKAADEKENK